MSGTAAGDSRQDLAAFLRTRRARVSPAEAGLPAGPRRRTPGLRREEVAVLAGMSPTWYAYLEQGRVINPSEQVLDALARVLRLDEDERRYMYLLAFGTGQDRQPLEGDLPAGELVRKLVGVAEDSPYPVYAADVLADITAWNTAFTQYYADFAAFPPGRRNMIRWLLFDPQARERLPDWTTDVEDVVARWRSTVAGYGDLPGLSELVAEFNASPDFTAWWNQHDVREHRSRNRRFALPGGGEQVLRVIVVQSIEFEPAFVVFHVPT